MFKLVDTDSDEEFALRQQRFMAPWEHDRGTQERIYEGERGYNPKRSDDYNRRLVRAAIYNKDVDGFTREEKYGNGRAEVGHIFAFENGGVGDARNLFMQESRWNESAQHKHDELHAAYNGYRRTAAAHEACMKHGDGFHRTRWGQMAPSDIVDKGKEQYKEVGVLLKKEGGVDRRCRAVKRGEIEVDKYGMVHGMKEKVQEIRALQKASHSWSSQASTMSPSPARWSVDSDSESN